MTVSVQQPPSHPDDDRPIVVRVFALTDVGHTREHNEDTFLVADLEGSSVVAFPEQDNETKSLIAGPHGLLFLVADGMGGAASGELASSMASDAILEWFKGHWQASNSVDPEAFAAMLRDATELANQRIHQHAREFPEHRGMGTTATVAGLLGDKLYLAQVGDSRAYLIRNGRAIQITKDQSLMQRLVEAGEMTQAEADSSERRNIILQALGPESQVTVDLTHQPVRLGDTLIMCSDGLSGLVKTEEIANIANDEHDVEALCHRLVDRANELGGTDNITVIAARFDGEGLIRSKPQDQIGHAPFPLQGTMAEEEADRTQPTPFRSDPTPAFGFPKLSREPLEEEFSKARDDEDELNYIGPDDDLEDRRRKARPVMVVLVLLLLAAAAYLVWRFFPKT